MSSLIVYYMLSICRISSLVSLVPISGLSHWLPCLTGMKSLKSLSSDYPHGLLSLYACRCTFAFLFPWGEGEVWVATSSPGASNQPVEDEATSVGGELCCIGREFWEFRCSLWEDRPVWGSSALWRVWWFSGHPSGYQGFGGPQLLFEAGPWQSGLCPRASRPKGEVWIACLLNNNQPFWRLPY